MTFKIGDKGFIRIKNIFVAAEVTAIDLPMVFTHQGNSIATPTMVTYLDDVGMATYSAITPDGVDPRNGNVFEVQVKRPETVNRICPIYNDGSPPMDFHTNTPENRAFFFSDTRIVGLLEATYTHATKLYSGHSFAPNPNLVEREILYGNSATPPKDSIQEAFEGLFKNRKPSTVELFDRLFSRASKTLDTLSEGEQKENARGLETFLDGIFSKKAKPDVKEVAPDDLSPEILFLLQTQARDALDNTEAKFAEVFEQLTEAATQIANAGKADATKVKALWNDIDAKFPDLAKTKELGPLAGVATVRAMINEISRLGKNELLREITRKDRANWKAFMESTVKVLFSDVDKSDPKD